MRKFTKRIEVTETCWNWLGAKSHDGYGHIEIGGKYFHAHVLIYILFKGRVPPKKIVRHSCDNRPCVNPEHLLVGTHGDNAKDKSERGRAGPFFKKRRILDTDVRAIRKMALKISHSKVAIIFKISRQHVGNIIHRRVGAHVN